MISFTGNQQAVFNDAAKKGKEVTVWCVKTPDNPFYKYVPGIPVPQTLAKSWGAKVSAVEAVRNLLGAVPFYYHIYTDVVDTPSGLTAAIKRMRTPESLFFARQKRITKKLQKTDPLFYDQMIDKVLSEDPFDIEHYKTKQAEKQRMMASVAATSTDIGKLWINPDAHWLLLYNWEKIHRELSRQVSYFDCVYQAWDKVTEIFDIRENKQKRGSNGRVSKTRVLHFNGVRGVSVG